MTNTTKFNVVNLKANTIFAPSVSMETIKMIRDTDGKSAATTIHLYLHMRSEYASYVSREQARDGKYDNTITCYYASNDTIAEDLGINIKTFESSMKTLKKLGLVVSLPFTMDKKERKNLVVLDPALKDYTAIMTECARRLSILIAEKRRNKKAQEQLDYITAIIGDDAEAVELEVEEVETLEVEVKLPIETKSETKQEPKEEQVNPFAEMLTEEAILARAAKPSSSITHLIEQSVDINPFANASSPFISTEPTVDEDYGYEANECGCGYCEVCLAEDEDYDY